MTTWDKFEDGKYPRICYCENLSTASVSGRMVYSYSQKNIRATEDRDSTYKIRTVVDHIKENFCLAGRCT